MSQQQLGNGSIAAASITVNMPVSIKTKKLARQSMPVQISSNSGNFWRGSASSEKKSIRNSELSTLDVPPAPAPAMYWSRASIYGHSPPKSLRAHSVNLVGELIFIFGGCDENTCYNDLYIFDAETMYWSNPQTNGEPPAPCRAHTSTLVDNKLFIFGGGDGPNYFNELYILDTDTLTWSKPKVYGEIPGPRRAHTACHYGKYIYLFGGGDGLRALNDVHRLDISDLAKLTWSAVEVKGKPPIPRGYHTGTLVENKLLIYGGSDGHECFSEAHVLDIETHTWEHVKLSDSVPRLSHTATQVGSYIFVAGGHDGDKYVQDVLLLNLVTMNWETRNIYGIPPTGRGYHTAVLYDSRLFVYGGYDGKKVYDEVYILDLSACAYLPQVTNFELGSY
ncbi:galactose oxidase [Basidiobolus meristosporus CBS 931.73]|uniref:Galactose oxidase n=1 Tax=Basidiobolus meristosporus CBS 931.73 TaxID=1314790 RepID=A0A1Y1Z8P0_9FUNG|nr:galactose oxidase [Basidiobolus meristosporus CBS 931.73]|eukprot:ORY06576.1 galactose oxidase [Basidiobolus meristosporus CBS 931.73]